MESSRLAKKSEFNLEEMINSTPSCLKIIDSKGHLITMNIRGLDLIGADDLESVIGADVYSLVEETHRDKFIEFNESICSGCKGYLIFEIIGLTGVRRWMESYAGPYPLPTGEIAHISITNDITSKVISNETLRTQEEALENAARLVSLGEFAGGVAHEINNPLTIIHGKVELLRRHLKKREVNVEDFEKSLIEIEETVNRISKIIQGLKIYSRDSKNDEKENCKLKDILESTLNLCGEKFKLDDIQISKNFSSDIEIYCNQVQISQVLMNLLNNSFDALAATEDKWIKIEAKVVGEKIRVLFTDSGNGISNEFIEKLMTPFFTTKEVGKGTGLGLSVSRGIIEAHSGRMFYNDASNNTQFIIELPIGNR
jgi:C4-dicarboxylate-specific signal transduction histidine kinase